MNYNLNKKMGRKASLESGQPMTTWLQKACFWMAILDVVSLKKTKQFSAFKILSK